MSKITLANLANLQNEATAVTAINSNSAILTTAVNNTLSRDGTSPNQMSAELDMNSNRIINLPAPGSSHEPIRLEDITDIISTVNTQSQVVTGNFFSSLVLFPETYGALGNGAHDDAAAIQAAIAAAAALKGGTVLLGQKTYAIGSTLDIPYSAITLRGCGAGMPHDGGSSTDPQTSLKWIGASGGTMVKFHTPYGQSLAMRSGGGVEDIQLDGSAVAGTGLLIDTFRRLNIIRTFVLNVTGRAYRITSGISNTDISEAADSKLNRFDRAAFRLIDSSAVYSANGFELDGSSNANACFNIFESCDGQFKNGTAFKMISCDNNVFISCGAFRASGGTGLIFDMSANAYNNYLYSPGTGGTGVSVVRTGSFGNVFTNIDTANGSVFPTLETGSSIIGNLAGLGPNNFKIGPTLELYNDLTNEHGVIKANVASDTSHRLQLSCDQLHVGTNVLSPSFTVAGTNTVLAGDIFTHPSTSVVPPNNGDLTIQATSNTSLTFKYKGSDGTVRSGSLTLS